MLSLLYIKVFIAISNGAHQVGLVFCNFFYNTCRTNYNKNNNKIIYMYSPIDFCPPIKLVL